MMKGIILAGGLGTRLYPLTKGISKQLLPVHDKPMIYYPLSILLRARIKEILLISTPNDLKNYIKLLGDGSNFGVKIKYIKQDEPGGLAEAFILGEKFIKNDNVCLILGDNIFYGNGIEEILFSAKNNLKKGLNTIFGYYVKEPERYGVVDFDDQGNAISIVEKPNLPKSNYAVVGIYFYTNSVIKIAKKISPSNRGELEITSINNKILKQNKLKVEIINKGITWLDTGTHTALSEASNFIKTIQNRTSLKISCPEEIAFKNGFIDKEKIYEIGKSMSNSDYGNYLLKIIENENY